MNLHDNKDAFAAAIQLASAPKEEGGLGIKEIYLEKDYWICRSLKMLSECKENEVAVFKGGATQKGFWTQNRHFVTSLPSMQMSLWPIRGREKFFKRGPACNVG